MVTWLRLGRRAQHHEHEQRAHQRRQRQRVGAIGGFEWKMFASWSLWVEYDHIFRRSDTLTYAVTR